MTFKKVLSFFLTGATALSMTTAALAADDTPIMLPADVTSQDWYAPALYNIICAEQLSGKSFHTGLLR